MKIWWHLAYGWGSGFTGLFIEYEVECGLLRYPMCLRAIRIRQRYHITVPIIFAICNVVVESRNDLGIKNFALFIGLQIEVCSCQLLHHNSSQIIRKTLDMGRGQLSAKMFDGTPKFATQSVLTIVATVLDVVFVIGVAFVSFEKLSVITALN